METSSRATKTAKKSRAEASKQSPAVEKNGSARNSARTLSSVPNRYLADIPVTATRQRTKKGLKMEDKPSDTKRFLHDSGIGCPELQGVQKSRPSAKTNAKGEISLFQERGASESTKIRPTPAKTKRTSGESQAVIGLIIFLGQAEQVPTLKLAPDPKQIKWSSERQTAIPHGPL